MENEKLYKYSSSMGLSCVFCATSHARSNLKLILVCTDSAVSVADAPDMHARKMESSELGPILNENRRHERGLFLRKTFFATS